MMHMNYIQITYSLYNYIQITYSTYAIYIIQQTKYHKSLSSNYWLVPTSGQLAARGTKERA